MISCKHAFSILKSLLISYAITGVMLLAIAFMLYKFHISEGVVNLAIIAVYVISSCVGGFIAGRTVEEKRFLMGLTLGLSYILVICVMALIINGTVHFSGVSAFTAALMCLAGGMLGGMLS